MNGIIAGSGCAILDCRASENIAEGIGANAAGHDQPLRCARERYAGDSTGSRLDRRLRRGGKRSRVQCQLHGDHQLDSAANNMTGISATSATVITGCSVSANGTDGIHLASGATVTAPLSLATAKTASRPRMTACWPTTRSPTTAQSSIAAEIHLTGKRNRVERNHLGNSSAVNNDFGLNVDAAMTGNVIVGNTSIGHKASGGSPSANYNVPASGNVIGTIVTDSTGANGAANALINISL